MSQLKLIVTADTAGLTAIKAATLELKQLLATSRLTSAAEIHKLTGAMLGAEAAANQATAAIAKNTVAIKAAKKAAADTATKTNALRDATRGAAAATGNLWMAYGQLLPLMGAFVVAASAIKGVKLSVEFEAQTQYTIAIAQATGDYSMRVDELRSKLLGVQGVSHIPQELAEASRDLVKAGFSSVQATAEIAEMSKTALAVQEDLSIVTKGVAAQYRAWGEEAVGTERGVSSLNQAANMMGFAALATATDFGELNSMLAYTTELGPLTGASFAEILAALGHMTNMGIRGTKAATALRTGMLKLQKPTKALAWEFDNLSVRFSAFNQEGELKGLVEMFEDLGKSIAPLTTEARTTLISDIFGLRSLKAAAAMTQAVLKASESGKFSLRGLVEEIEKAGVVLDFVNGAFKEITDTTKGQFLLLIADAARAMTEAFYDSNGALRGLIATARGLIEDGSFRLLIDNLALATEQAIKFVDQISKLAGHLKDVIPLLPKIGLRPTHIIGTNKSVFELAGSVKRLSKELVKAQQSGAENWVIALNQGVAAYKNSVDEAKIATEGLNNALEKTIPLHRLGDIAVSPLTQEIKDGTAELEKFIERKNQADKPWNLLTKSVIEVPVLTGDYALEPAHARLEEDGVMRGRGFRPGTEERPDPGTAKLEQARIQRSLTLEAQRIQSIAKLRANAASREVTLADAWFKAQTISEEEHIANVRRLRETELDLQIADAKKVLEVNKRQHLAAQKFAESELENASAKKAAETAVASALDKVSRQVDKIKELEGKKLFQALLVEPEDIARTKAFDRSLRGVYDAAKNIQELSEIRIEFATANEAEIRLQKTLLKITQDRSQAYRDLHDQQIKETDERFLKTKAAFDSMVRAAEEAYTAEQMLREDWLKGVEKSFADYAHNAKDYFGQAKNFADNAFQGMEDALVEFVKTGKLSFEDLIDSMIADIARLMAKQAIAGLVSTIDFSSLFTETSGGLGFSTATAAYQSGFADGGVPSSGLSDYSGTVVSQPTLFEFASGVGLMGEAGEEAILPLKRGSDGKLGVSAAGQNSVPNVEVNVYNEGEKEKDAKVETRMDVKGLVIDVFLSDMIQNGPMKRAMRSAG